MQPKTTPVFDYGKCKPDRVLTLVLNNLPTKRAQIERAEKRQKETSFHSLYQSFFLVATDAITRSVCRTPISYNHLAFPTEPLKPPEGRVSEGRAGGSSIIFGTRFSSSVRHC